MLRWWYGNVPGTMTYAGETCPRYLVWHPLDHISYQVVGHPGTVADDGSDPVRTGSKLWIREALHRNSDQLIDIRVIFEELAPNRAVIGKRLLGTTIVRLENDFTDGPAGATYRTTPPSPIRLAVHLAYDETGQVSDAVVHIEGALRSRGLTRADPSHRDRLTLRPDLVVGIGLDALRPLASGTQRSTGLPISGDRRRPRATYPAACRRSPVPSVSPGKGQQFSPASNPRLREG